MTTGQLARWLRRESPREARRATVTDVLVFGHFHRYLWHRSMRFALSRMVQTLLHVCELSLLYLFAQQSVFISAAVVTIGLHVTGSAWWGGLEILRSGVRVRARDGRYAGIGAWIHRWLIAATALACVVWSAAIVFAFMRSRSRSLDVGDVYAVSRVITFGLELVVRTFHSGAYALRRIHQPTWSLLASSIVRAVLLLTLWPAMAVWSIPIATAGSGLTAAFLTARFTWRTYGDLEIQPLLRRRRRSSKWPRIRLRDAGRLIAAAAANAGSNVAHLWAFALLSLGLSDPELWLAVFVYIVLAAPLLEACVAWARLFYPDLVKLEDDLLLPYRATLQRQMTRWSPVVGTVAWLPSLLLIPLLPGSGHIGLVAVLTWLFFVARARLAAVQIIAFCDRRYLTLLAVAAGLGLATVAAYFLPAILQLVWLIVVLLSCSVAFRPAAATRSWDRPVLPLAAAVTRAARVEGEGTWVLSDFQPGRLLHGPLVLLHRVAREVGALGLDRDRFLLWWEPHNCGAPAGGGLTQGFEQRRWRSASGGAPETLPAFGQRWPAEPLPAPCTVADVIDGFRARFPRGFCVRAGETAAPGLRRLLTWRERQFVLDEALAHAYGRPPQTLLSLDVSALIDQGQLTALFFLQRDTSPEARRRWRRDVRRIAIANAFAALGECTSNEVRA